MLIALLASRLIGLLRDHVLFGLVGLGAVNDVILLASKLGNTLQNLLGEQALSASFIPAYSERLGDSQDQTSEDASRLAGAAFARLLLVAGILGIVGSLIAPQLGLLMAKKGPESVSLLTLASRFLFPMTALLVMASWCLSVLNSHRRFVLPYVAPVFWNLSILGAMGILWVRTQEPSPAELVLFFSVGSLVGGALQFGVQLPAAIRLNGGLPLTLSSRVDGLSQVQSRFAPVLAGRGSLQLISVIEALIAAAILSEGTLSGLSGAQRLFFLALMLTSMIQAAVYLPEFSRIKVSSVMSDKFREALHGVWFLAIPTMVGILAFGFPIVAAIYFGGKFGAVETLVVYLTLGLYILGLIPIASTRILQSVLYAQGQTKLPAIIGTLKAVASLAIAWLAKDIWTAIPVNAVGERIGLALPESELMLGGLTFASASSLMAFAEWFVLKDRSAVDGVLEFGKKAGAFSGIALVALVPPVLAWWMFSRGFSPGVRILTFDIYYVVQAALVLGGYIASYLGLARIFGMAEYYRLVRAR